MHRVRKSSSNHYHPLEPTELFGFFKGWPLLNALVNTAAGASWVSIHNGGGVGIGYSLHAGQVTVADGTDMMAKRIERVLTTDPGMGVIRHVDAGYDEAKEFAKKTGVKVPMGRR